MPKCGVCNEQEFKYKCPKCKLRYCSLACFKIHKETPCGPDAIANSTSASSGNINNNDSSNINQK
eukprot:Pgem_evm1s17197